MVGVIQTPPPPKRQTSLSTGQVSEPSAPGSGMTSNSHRRSPVWASTATTRPLG